MSRDSFGRIPSCSDAAGRRRPCRPLPGEQPPVMVAWERLFRVRTTVQGVPTECVSPGIGAVPCTTVTRIGESAPGVGAAAHRLPETASFRSRPNWADSGVDRRRSENCLTTVTDGNGQIPRLVGSVRPSEARAPPCPFLSLFGVDDWYQALGTALTQPRPCRFADRTLCQALPRLELLGVGRFYRLCHTGGLARSRPRLGGRGPLSAHQRPARLRVVHDVAPATVLPGPMEVAEALPSLAYRPRPAGCLLRGSGNVSRGTEKVRRPGQAAGQLRAGSG